MGDLKRRLGEYESKTQMFTLEIDRLNGVLRSKLDAEGSLDSQNRTLIRDLELARSKISEL